MTDPRRAITDLEGLVRHLDGRPPREIVPITGKGITNLVFRVVTSDADQWIVRIREDEESREVYRKEERAMVLAEQAGVPVPRVLHVGYGIIPFSYAVHSFVPGTHGADYDGDPEPFWMGLGRLASRINSIRMEGFGLGFSAEDGRIGFQDTWSSFIEERAGSAIDLDELCEHGVLSSTDTEGVIERIEAMKRWDCHPSLVHGDLLPTNVLVDHDGRITAVLDWSNAASLIAPHCELATSLVGTPEEHRGTFLKGYGMDEADYSCIEREVETMQLCRALGACNWLIQEGLLEELPSMAERVRLFLAR